VDERERFVRGTSAGALLACAAGAVALLAAGRPAWALAFAVGAGISLGNFRLIAGAVRALDQGGGGAAWRWRDLWKGGLIRFGITGAVLVLALVVFRAPLLPLVAGLLVAQLWMIGHWLWVSVRAL
jgi:hypothetical protein